MGDVSKSSSGQTVLHTRSLGLNTRIEEKKRN
jgi:hypothetical protein